MLTDIEVPPRGICLRQGKVTLTTTEYHKFNKVTTLSKTKSDMAPADFMEALSMLGKMFGNNASFSQIVQQATKEKGTCKEPLENVNL